jgi:hypothetical protein
VADKATILNLQLDLAVYLGLEKIEQLAAIKSPIHPRHFYLLIAKSHGRH